MEVNLPLIKIKSIERPPLLLPLSRSSSKKPTSLWRYLGPFQETLTDSRTSIERRHRREIRRDSRRSRREEHFYPSIRSVSPRNISKSFLFARWMLDKRKLSRLKGIQSHPIVRILLLCEILRRKGSV